MAGVSSSPRPSSAPIADPVNVTSPMSPMYSPIESVPESRVESVPESSYSEPPTIPNLMELSPTEALNELFATDPPEFTAETTNQWWAADSQIQAYSLFSPTWVDKVREHTCVHSFSLQPNSAPEEYSCYYLHSTKKTITNTTDHEVITVGLDAPRNRGGGWAARGSGPSVFTSAAQGSVL
eukprot:5049757-Amphidinium_carterae.1